MKELYLEMENKNVPIDQQQIDKYNLKAGSISPNNGYHVVNRSGDENNKPNKNKPSAKHSNDDMMSDGIIFTTSETIDLARGSDSKI